MSKFNVYSQCQCHKFLCLVGKFAIQFEALEYPVYAFGNICKKTHLEVGDQGHDLSTLFAYCKLKPFMINP